MEVWSLKLAPVGKMIKVLENLFIASYLFCGCSNTNHHAAPPMRLVQDLHVEIARLKISLYLPEERLFSALKVGALDLVSSLGLYRSFCRHFRPYALKYIVSMQCIVSWSCWGYMCLCAEITTSLYT